MRDVCISHQSDWIYYKQPIKFLVVPGKWYVRRFDPDMVQYGLIYSSITEGEVFIYLGLFRRLLGVMQRTLWGGGG